MAKLIRFSALFIAVLSILAPSARAEETQASAGGDSSDQALCAMIETAATANNLPVGFLTRLIWRESALRPESVSPAGAQGVAQFMPRTAAERGLANPFDPATAIPEAAKFLAELSARFGNLGLAAAAYNAGPALAAKWIAGQGDLPPETRAYVYAITARGVDDWAKAPPTPAAAPDNQPCLPIIAAMRSAAPPETIALSPFAPWGVQLAGNFSKALALAAFARDRQKYQTVIGDTEPFVLASRIRSRGPRTFFRVRLPAPTRAQAQTLCRKLHSVGAACIVLRS
jgi:hypothetical protein